MNPVIKEIKTQGPKVISKSPLWLFLTKEDSTIGEAEKKSCKTLV